MQSTILESFRFKPTIWWLLFITSVTSQAVPPDSQYHSDYLLLSGSYCRARPQQRQCCRGRDDDCAMPILGTLCYCDEFCDRVSNDDCCPDFWRLCRGVNPPTPPPPPIQVACYYQNRYLHVGQSTKINCNECTCRQISPSKADLVCDQKKCMIDPELMQKVNSGNFGWKAYNYTKFWGRTVEDGVRHRLGTCKPEIPVMKMMSVPMRNDIQLPHTFDSRSKWPNLITPIRDQGEYPASWAISTVDVAADRLAIQSMGMEVMQLSAQQILSCMPHRRNTQCSTGYTDRAWQFLSIFGVVLESCYPYRSGTTGAVGRCEVPRLVRQHTSPCANTLHGGSSMLYHTPPPYRISEKENDIMIEIFKNGPVQALMQVREDFYMYKSGVYRYTNLNSHIHESLRPSEFHAVRIIGWGEERSQYPPVKYWIAANSWGNDWGENGYFRIIRGQDECDIEMFVVAVWAKRNGVHHNGNGNGGNNNHVNDLDPIIQKK